MGKFFQFLLCFLVSELILAFIYQATARIFYRKIGLDFRSIAKGMMERVFLLVSLHNSYPHAITFFSAVKLATRLKHREAEEKDENRFNDYYLMGNLSSVMAAIGYTSLWANFDEARERWFGFWNG